MIWARVVVCFALWAASVHAAENSSAHAYQVLHRFKSAPDGLKPHAEMTVCGGKFFGTTAGGGKDYGTVFSFDPASGEEVVVYAFSGGTDGNGPYSGLACFGSVVYGNTNDGGTSNFGVIFGVDVKTGKETVLHSFAGDPDGQYPSGTLLQVDGLLYGTTSTGGTSGYGTIFSLDPSTGTYHVLYSFNGPPDGQYPEAGLIYERSVLYGTTTYGGTNPGNGGTVFKFDLAAAAETVLYSFTNGADGGNAAAPLLGEDNLLFGTTFNGGAFRYGTVFQFDALTGQETVLHSFGGGSDGENPFGAPLIDMGGLLYGSTSDTVFQTDPRTGAGKPLHHNLAHPNGLTARKGVLYGTTYVGGKTGNGTIFRLTP